MRYLGIDYGEKRIGLAVSDEGGVFAFPKQTIPSGGKAVEMIAALIREEGIKGVVIGIPATYSGTQNEVETAIRDFAHALEANTGVTPVFENEQFSSREASRFAPGEKKDDAVSAALILQRFLDAHPSGR